MDGHDVAMRELVRLINATLETMRHDLRARSMRRGLWRRNHCGEPAKSSPVVHLCIPALRIPSSSYAENALASSAISLKKCRVVC